MLGPLCRHHEAVWANRTAILKEDSDLHVCIGVTGVQYADRFMARHERSLPGALAGNEAFRDRPILPSPGGHRLLLLCSARLWSCPVAAEPRSINPAGSTQPDHLIPSEKRYHIHIEGRATIESRWHADVGKVELTDQSLDAWGAEPFFRQSQRHSRGGVDHRVEESPLGSVDAGGHVKRQSGRALPVCSADKRGHGTARRALQAIADQSIQNDGRL